MCTSWPLEFHVWVKLVIWGYTKIIFYKLKVVWHFKSLTFSYKLFCSLHAAFPVFHPWKGFIELIPLFKCRSKAKVSHIVLLFILRLFQSTKGVFDQFPVFLSSATKELPLVILLDSLDQLSPLDGARKLTWFPRKLPLHVKFIVSTLPDEEYKCFPTLKVCGEMVVCNVIPITEKMLKIN